MQDDLRCQQLFLATRSGDFEMMSGVTDEEIKRCRDFFGRTLAMVAAFYGQKSILDLLVVRGCEFDIMDSHGRTLSYYLANFDMASAMEKTVAKTTRDLLDDLLKKPSTPE